MWVQQKLFKSLHVLDLHTTITTPLIFVEAIVDTQWGVNKQRDTVLPEPRIVAIRTIRYLKVDSRQIFTDKQK